MQQRREDEVNYVHDVEFEDACKTGGRRGTGGIQKEKKKQNDTKRNETKKNSTEVELDGWAVAGVKASRADG